MATPVYVSTDLSPIESHKEELSDAVAKAVERSREAQGLPPKVENASALSRVIALLA